VSASNIFFIVFHSALSAFSYIKMPTEDSDSSRHAWGVVKVGLERDWVVVLWGDSFGYYIGLRLLGVKGN